jgi:hypothetical protein
MPKNFKGIGAHLLVNNIMSRVLKPTPHPKPLTPINASQSPTLYYLEAFPVG